MKDIKIILKNKKTKDKKKPEKDIKNFTEEEKEKRRKYYQERKQKLPKYRRNHYLTYKK